MHHPDSWWCIVKKPPGLNSTMCPALPQREENDWQSGILKSWSLPFLYRSYAINGSNSSVCWEDWISRWTFIVQGTDWDYCILRPQTWADCKKCCVSRMGTAFFFIKDVICLFSVIGRPRGRIQSLVKVYTRHTFYCLKMSSLLP